MKVFFDNCTSPVLADALHALVKVDRGIARHIRDMAELGLSPSTPDAEWIDRLANDRDGPWIVITGDGRIRRNKAERTAWIRSGLKGFVLPAAYQKTPVHEQASVLLWRWPAMAAFIREAAPGSMFELSFNRRTGFKPLAV